MSYGLTIGSSATHYQPQLNNMNQNNTDEDAWIEIDADGSDGTGPALAHVLRSIADTLDKAPDDRRYDFDLTIDESRT